MKHPLLFIGLLMLGFACSRQAENPRSIEKFNQNWRFALADDSLAATTEFDDSAWRMLNLPHDWSIEGEFSEKHPADVGGGALPGGLGWYRKKFNLAPADSNKRIYLKFDGVYMNSEVYVNGTLAGKRPFGYITFEYDITPWVFFDGSANVIAVKVDNSKQPNSRWYSGSGIYRNVWLTKTQPVHVNLWGTYITTPEVSEKVARISIETEVKNTTAMEQTVELTTTFLNPQQKKVGSVKHQLKVSGLGTEKIQQQLSINNPVLWDIEQPELYTAISEVRINGILSDRYETPFGIRYFNFDAETGFSLNGKPLKILGVCNHHDLGSLGTAVNYRALERQLEIMKEMGVNGIRTSHNPPAPELLDLCDKMGFIVMDETFDIWALKKTAYDYSIYWGQWHEKDLSDHILRDRNHPSIFIWSIGNEIIEQWDTTGITLAKKLASIVRTIDATRPITSALNDPEPNNNIYKSGALDLVGFNYHQETFEAFQTKFPGQKFIATETTSSLHTRGFYDMPSDSIRRWPERWDKPFNEGNPNNTCSAYDNCSAPWGSTHEETWKIIKKHDYLSGMYIWTGFDYLGEPTPYGWPSRSSYFGIVDLAGFPKDAFYMYQSEWTNKDVLHLFPHWNWTPGKMVDVWAYTNYDEVELFVNDQSQGAKSKQGDDLHLQWRVTYQPGTLKAIGKKADGTTKEVVIHTAGKPAKIQLIADRNTLAANGEDLSFITVNVLDKDNNPVPYADNLIHFNVPESLEIAGVDNGNQISHEPFKANYRKAFNGKCLLIVKSKLENSNTIVQATSEGLSSEAIEIITKK
ncbi:MAG: glycoside hydrolase family 2 [Bacteroidetes bacterium HGW-Bacteroidetes-4]|nr:MAG: glycoside hydrolase family 2 [Bacteroidetes bacterium HGW-Bacteroidetes-4]